MGLFSADLTQICPSRTYMYICIHMYLYKYLHSSNKLSDVIEPFAAREEGCH